MPHIRLNPLARLLLLALAGMLLGTAQAQAYLEEADLFAERYLSGGAFPLLSARDDFASEADAYTFQDAYVDALVARGEEIVGYKLGFTGPSNPLGAPGPVLGRILASQMHEDGASVGLGDTFTNGNVGFEVAFIMGQDVSAPMSAAALRAAVAEVAPAMEFPDFAFEDPDNLSYLDLIAANTVSRTFVLGERVPLSELGVELDDIKIEGRLDGETIITAVGSDAVGGQFNALEFLADGLSARGQSLRAGDIVVTGALGGDAPLQVGTYEGDFGPLGTVAMSFE